ncbi:MAG: acyltransferase [Lachnospiraceae bacterium]|nr:acyltransferase [Lachnospiraceae bacterium]
MIGRWIRKLKQKFYTWRVKRACAYYGADLKVNHRCQVTNQTFLRDNVNFNGMYIAGQGKVEIGNNFHSGIECMILTQNHNYDKGNKIPYDDTVICKDIKIKDQVWLGNRVLILGGVTIGEGAIIQAGSVVSSNIPDYAIAGGNPARVFKMRDIEHYNRLKSEEKFK